MAAKFCLTKYSQCFLETVERPIQLTHVLKDKAEVRESVTFYFTILDLCSYGLRLIEIGLSVLQVALLATEFADVESDTAFSSPPSYGAGNGERLAIVIGGKLQFA